VAVLAYWHELMSTDPGILQDRIDAMTGSIHAPVLALFGRQPGAEERDRFALLPAAKVEAWVGGGHFLHLADPRPLRPAAPGLRRNLRASGVAVANGGRLTGGSKGRTCIQPTCSGLFAEHPSGLDPGGQWLTAAELLRISVWAGWEARSAMTSLSLPPAERGSP
jgi:hypothetical protein